MRTERRVQVDEDFQQKMLQKLDVGHTSNQSHHVEPSHRATPAQNPVGALASMRAIVIIDPRSLTRECLARALRSLSDTPIVSLPSIEAWSEVANTMPALAILLCISGIHRDPDIQRKITLIELCSNLAPIIILGETEDPELMIEFLDSGARGYISTSMSLPVTLKALLLVAEGGVFIPANSLIASQRQVARSGKDGHGEKEMFTSRQAAVVKAVCLGKANKVIAYDLNMCESTVKVHVRNIMKKLKAKNRTEVAMIVKSSGDAGPLNSRINYHRDDRDDRDVVG